MHVIHTVHTVHVIHVIHTVHTKHIKMLFFSRSKDEDARYISTMQVCEIVIDGKKYMSMEHYFQSQKYPPEKRHLFEKGGLYKMPKEAKRAGGKGGMKKNKCKLNITQWNGMSKDNNNDFHRIYVMKRAICARFQQDKRFRDILTRSNVAKIANSAS